MILRFASYSTSEYVAFNTEFETYTTNPEQVKQGQVLTVPAETLWRILAEIDFNCYDYSDDLHTPVEPEEIPLF